MRDIKFRAWSCRSMMFFDKPEDFKWFFCGLDGPQRTLTSCEFMQYTGLKDKNGKEIYEGDIIKDSFGDRIGIIRYNAHLAAYELSDYDGIHLLSAINGETFFEVIGNIYENPDLLRSNQ